MTFIILLLSSVWSCVSVGVHLYNQVIFFTSCNQIVAGPCLAAQAVLALSPVQHNSSVVEDMGASALWSQSTANGALPPSYVICDENVNDIGSLLQYPRYAGGVSCVLLSNSTVMASLDDTFRYCQWVETGGFDDPPSFANLLTASDVSVEGYVDYDASGYSTCAGVNRATADNCTVCALFSPSATPLARQYVLGIITLPWTLSWSLWFYLMIREGIKMVLLIFLIPWCCCNKGRSCCCGTLTSRLRHSTVLKYLLNSPFLLPLYLFPSARRLAVTAEQVSGSSVLVANIVLDDLPLILLPVYVLYINGTRYTNIESKLSLAASTVMIGITGLRIAWGYRKVRMSKKPGAEAVMQGAVVVGNNTIDHMEMQGRT